MLEAFISGLMLGAGLIVAIGAQNAYVLRQGLRQEHVGLVVLTCLMGDVICITAGVAGVGAIIASHPLLLTIATWGGAIFLFWYGTQAFRRALRANNAMMVSATGERMTAQVALGSCLAFTFLNPHVYLDTVVLLGSLSTQYVPSGNQWWFGLGAMCASLIWFVSLGYGARLLSPLFRKPRAWQVFDFVVAVLLWILAASLLQSEFAWSMLK